MSESTYHDLILEKKIREIVEKALANRKETVGISFTVACPVGNKMSLAGMTMSDALALLKSWNDETPVDDGWISVEERLPEEDSAHCPQCGTMLQVHLWYGCTPGYSYTTARCPKCPYSRRRSAKPAADVHACPGAVGPVEAPGDIKAPVISSDSFRCPKCNAVLNQSPWGFNDGKGNAGAGTDFHCPECSYEFLTSKMVDEPEGATGTKGHTDPVGASFADAIPPGNPVEVVPPGVDAAEYAICRVRGHNFSDITNGDTRAGYRALVCVFCGMRREAPLSQCRFHLQARGSEGGA